MHFVGNYNKEIQIVVSVSFIVKIKCTLLDSFLVIITNKMHIMVLHDQLMIRLTVTDLNTFIYDYFKDTDKFTVALKIVASNIIV